MGFIVELDISDKMSDICQCRSDRIMCAEIYVQCNEKPWHKLTLLVIDELLMQSFAFSVFQGSKMIHKAEKTSEVYVIFH